MQFSSIWPTDKTPLGATNPGQSRPGSDDNKRVYCISQSSTIRLFSLILGTHIQEVLLLLDLCTVAVSVFYSCIWMGTRSHDKGVLPLCINAVGVFYSHIWLGTSSQDEGILPLCKMQSVYSTATSDRAPAHRMRESYLSTRCSRCILQPHLKGHQLTGWGNLTALQDAVVVFYSHIWLGTSSQDEGVLPLCIDAVVVFYSHIWLGTNSSDEGILPLCSDAVGAFYSHIWLCTNSHDEGILALCRDAVGAFNSRILLGPNSQNAGVFPLCTYAVGVFYSCSRLDQIVVVVFVFVRNCITTKLKPCKPRRQVLWNIPTASLQWGQAPRLCVLNMILNNMMVRLL